MEHEDGFRPVNSKPEDNGNPIQANGDVSQSPKMEERPKLIEIPVEHQFKEVYLIPKNEQLLLNTMRVFWMDQDARREVMFTIVCFENGIYYLVPENEKMTMENINGQFTESSKQYALTATQVIKGIERWVSIDPASETPVRNTQYLII